MKDGQESRMSLEFQLVIFLRNRLKKILKQIASCFKHVKLEEASKTHVGKA